MMAGSRGMRCLLRGLVPLLVVAAMANVRGQQVPIPPDPRIEEARLAFESTEYERAREILDGLISRISVNTGDPSQRQTLQAAYDLRGRTRLLVRDAEGARSDFRTVLLLNPAFTLPPQAGGPTLDLFEEVRNATVREVAISVTPSDAVLNLGKTVLTDRPARTWLIVGTSYEVAASRRGYGAKAQIFTPEAGPGLQEIPIVLVRQFATLTLTTAPAAVDVLIDGVVRGHTEIDPNVPPPGLGQPAESKALSIDELTAGRHQIELRRDCYEIYNRTLDIPSPDDVKIGLIPLRPAVATVAISSDAPGAIVFVDDKPSGPPPQTLNNICQGPHTFEVRTLAGRHLRRLDLKPGQQETFAARVRPAFAIVSDSGVNAGIVGAPDLRLMAENVFQDARTLTLFASPATKTQEMVTADQLPADWLAFDDLRQALGGAKRVGDPARRSAGTKLAKAFDAQGVAAVTRDPVGDRSEMFLILLAPGSARPDVVRWQVDNPLSVRQALGRLDVLPPVTRSSLGLLAVDVLDVEGAVVASIDQSGGGGATAGLQPGDVVTAAGGTAVTSAARLLAVVNDAPAGKPLSLDVRDRSGAMKKVEVTAQRVPRLLEEHDQTVMSNVLAVQFASMVRAASSPLDEVALRLNLAGALMRVDNWLDAMKELDAASALAEASDFAPAVKAAITGSAQYLLGTCAAATGDLPGAQKAWGLAAQSSSALLTDAGEPLKELAERRLAELGNRGSTR
jgi:hypothetical protein